MVMILLSPEASLRFVSNLQIPETLFSFFFLQKTEVFTINYDLKVLN